MNESALALRPKWERPALAVLLLAPAALYLWDLSASGWANSFYSAAVQAGTKSWKAFFFGSSDASNFITVDKTPGALWLMEISARIFGVNSWSILVPEALEGVGAVALLYATVRRWFSPVAALLAGAVMALTPIAAVMFRFNNPDALLVLLLVGAAYALTRSLERGSTKWLALVGALIGFGFLAKMLQAFLVVPGFALTYLLFAPVAFKRRVVQLLVGGATMIAAGGWWVAIVELWPKASRPYIGGSQTNSVLDLMFGYNGFGRLSGNESGSVGGGATAGSRWGATGVTRLVNHEMGGQISWLIPAAVVLLVGALILNRRSRSSRVYPALAIWGSWLIVTGAALSLGQGIIHPYYTVALAPAIAAIVGIGATLLWDKRESWVSRIALATALVLTAVWTFLLLRRTPDWNSWLQFAVLAPSLAIAVLIIGIGRLRGRLGAAVASAAVGLSLLAPSASTMATVSTPHTGAIVAATPTTQGGGFGGGRPGGLGGRRTGGFVGAPGRGAPGGIGGILQGSTPSAAFVSFLKTNASTTKWAAAVVSSNQAAGYQLATGLPIMALGGFNGTDPAPSLIAFQQYVTSGQIRYFIGGGQGRGGFGGGRGVNSSTTNVSTQITTWVSENYTSATVGGVTVYDLLSPIASTAGSELTVS